MAVERFTVMPKNRRSLFDESDFGFTVLIFAPRRQRLCFGLAGACKKGAGVGLGLGKAWD